MGRPRATPIRTRLSHPVYLGGDLPDLRAFARGAFPRHRRVLVTQEGLDRLLAPALLALRRQLDGAPLLVTRRGERHKSRREKERLEDALLALGCGRDTLLVAVGGGTLTDLAGFAAATFLRGVPWVVVPSTLLGMVDAALGGKTGVNVPAGKNLVGQFHLPAAVFESLCLLDTLPPREWRNGLGECLKHGLTSDAAYFAWLAETPLSRLREGSSAVRRLVETSVAIKGAIVAKDPLERSGARHLLNAGHTVGHALEALSGYRVPHGAAVAAGLCWEAAVSCAEGRLARADLREVAAAAARHGFAPHWERFAPSAVLAAAGADKKNRGGEVRYVPLSAIGRPALPPPHTAPLTLAGLTAGRRLLRELGRRVP